MSFLNALRKGNMKFINKSLCLILSVLMMLSVLSIVPVQVFAASASDYIAQSYASNLSVKTTKTTSLMKYPTSDSAYSEYTVASGTMLTVKELHKDNSGKYWYEVLYYNLTLYVDATATTMVDHLTGDVNATNLQSPASLTYGGSFPIKGTITSTLNDIGTVTAAMYSGSNLSRTPAIESSDTVNGKSYVLDSSTVDNNLLFGSLATGVYTYMVSAEAVSYYIDDNGSFATSAVDVILQTKLCVVTTGSSPNPVLHNGIDVSVWNGTINWATVKTEVDFAILRASWEETADTKFYTNANGCVENGIPFGVYVYSYAENEAEAIGEAEYVLSLVDGYDLDLPIFLDFEDEVLMNLSTSTQQAVVKAFCDTIFEAGYQPGLYTYYWLLNSAFTGSYYKSIATWVAEIKSGYTSYSGGLWLWQYSWTGSFSGISGDVDCNKMYVELPGTGSSDTSYLASCTYYPSNLMVTTNSDTNVRQYPASTYTLLDTLSSGTSVHVTGLYKNAYGNFWYQIEHDGVTGYVYADEVTVTEYLYDDISVKNVSMASNLDLGKGYYIQGDLASKWNNLSTVYAKVYSGENTQETPTLTSSYSPNSKEYSLYKSEVDYGLTFGSQPKGYYTYEISVDAKNYYATDATTLASKTENVVVWTAPYTVDNASIDPPNETVCSHVIVVQPAVEATCTETGLSAGSYCSECGEVFAVQETVPAKGHSYSVVTVPSNCLDYEHGLYTCTNCGDYYKTYLTEENTTDWVETLPEGTPEKLYVSKTEYRYSDYEQVQSYETSLDGYTLYSKEWESQGTKTLDYVKTWPDGFDTANSFYSQYNSTPKTAYNDTYYSKLEVESDELLGYVYYHWCRGRVLSDGPYNATTSKVNDGTTFTAFHAFFSTSDPSTMTTASDSSVTYPNKDCCSDSWWYYNVPVYRQTYTEYKALYTHSRWTDWSDWSEKEVTAAWNKKVESRTLYRYSTATLGDHIFVDGYCSYCTAACEHNWVDSKCTICNLRCEHSYANGECSICGKICSHHWAEGSCFLCAVQCEHTWTDGVCDTCKLNCSHNYNNGCCTICQKPCSPHNFVNGICQVCKLVCEHSSWYDGKCSTCGTSCDHSFSQGSCTNCSASCTHNWSEGECTICQLVCVHTWSNGECTVCDVVCEHIWVDGKCSVCSKICYHDFVNGSCTVCQKPCVHKWSNGHCTVCGYVCGHSWVDGKCEICSFVCGHSYSDGTCTNCGYNCQHSWLVGKCTICSVECEHNWYNGKCTVCSLLCGHTYKDGVCTNCGYNCDHYWQNGVCIECGYNCEHSFSQGSCTVCGESCDHIWEDSTCTKCEQVCSDHRYIDGLCAVCSKVKPDLYLYGFINGEEYGFGEDADNIGTYKFVDGQLVVTFAQDSYVAVKDGDNENCYMTNGYQGDNVTLAVLYNSKILGGKADKLFVPKGREITFTLIENGNDTLTLYYVAAACEHTDHSTDGICTACDAQVDHTYADGKCSVCSLECYHTFISGICTVCGMECDHNWVDSRCTECSKVCAHRFKDGECTVCGFVCGHNFSDGDCTVCGMDCVHSFTDGKCTVCGYICEHSYSDGVCTECGSICEHIFSDGICTNCRYVCVHNYEDGVCTVCGYTCGHSFSDDECTDCGTGMYYLSGYINGESVGCDENYSRTGGYKFTDGELVLNITEDSYVFVKTYDNSSLYMAEGNVSGTAATLYNLSAGKVSGMFLLPGGTQVSLILFKGRNDTLALLAQIIDCSHLEHSADGSCTVCGEEAEHSYSAGKCVVCKSAKPEKDMYLFGFINGINYACEENAQYTGEYKFVDGQLVATFTQDSYVAVKTADNSDWYMTNGWLGEDTTLAILHSTASGIIADKLFVPGNTEITFNLTNNGNDTFTLSYVAEKADSPEIQPKFTRLSYENEISYEVCFKVSNMDGVSQDDMGLAIFSDEKAEAPAELVSGVYADGKYLVAGTNAIHPKALGDTVHFKIYAVLSDGTYVYSDMLSVNAVDYANKILRSSSASKEQKAALVALLNYGAQAQLYFGYNTDKLANAGLEAEHRALVKKYSKSMADDLVLAQESKIGSFAKTSTNALLYPAVSFEEESFTVNYNCIVSSAQGDVTLCYWDSDTYNSVSTLTAENATGTITMTKGKNGVYTAAIGGIAAKDMDKTIYVSVVYTANGESLCTGVISYSFAEYCKLCADSTNDAQELAQAAVVYGYYAKKLFA